jgi:hypothetical protein
MSSRAVVFRVCPREESYPQEAAECVGEATVVCRRWSEQVSGTFQGRGELRLGVEGDLRGSVVRSEVWGGGGWDCESICFFFKNVIVFTFTQKVCL